MTATPKMTALAGLVAAQFLISGCATAGKLVGDGAAAKTQPANAKMAGMRGAPKVDKRAREKIAREDILTQMSFWAQETALFPNDSDAALAFSEVLRKGGRADRAAEVARAALDREPDNRALMRSYGLALLGSGKSFEAMRPLKQLANVDDKDVRARSALGIALDEQGRYDEARAAYREALAIQPDDASVLTNLGVSYLLSGEPAKAEEVLRQASALPGATAGTRQNLALAIGLQGRFAEAEQLQKVDLPPALVANNMAYLRGLISDDRRWGDLKN
jgi:Flp pilus assembly protein TadD